MLAVLYHQANHRIDYSLQQLPFGLASVLRSVAAALTRPQLSYFSVEAQDHELSDGRQKVFKRGAFVSELQYKNEIRCQYRFRNAILDFFDILFLELFVGVGK